MLVSITERVTVRSGGLVEIRRPELVEGTEAEVTVTVETTSEGTSLTLDDLPADHLGAWPSNLSLRREDLYSDEGR